MKKVFNIRKPVEFVTKHWVYSFVLIILAAWGLVEIVTTLRSSLMVPSEEKVPSDTERANKAIKEELSFVRLGSSFEKIKESLGAADKFKKIKIFEDEYAYRLYVKKLYYLQAIENSKKEIVFFAVTIRSRLTEYHIPYGWGRKLVLGKATFADFESTPVSFLCDYSNGGGFQFCEIYYWGRSGAYSYFLVGYTTTGYYDKEISSILYKYFHREVPREAFLKIYPNYFAASSLNPKQIKELQFQIGVPISGHQTIIFGHK